MYVDIHKCAYKPHSNAQPVGVPIERFHLYKMKLPYTLNVKQQACVQTLKYLAIRSI